ncbi:MAG: MurR/RpiR family transcriptional regulator [Actinomycetes bacterium]
MARRPTSASSPAEATMRQPAPPETSPPQTVADVVRAGMGDLSAAELRVARALLAEYPTAGLGSTADLAARGEVSPPTVVRLIARLGFAGYRDFQQRLRDELQRERSASPLTIRRDVPGDNLRAVSEQVFNEAMGRTFAELPDHELDRAVALLADQSKKILSLGGRYSHVLATYLDLHLRQMRPGTRVLLETPTRRAGYLLDVGRNDVCVVFDFRRYQRDVIELASYARAEGASLLLVTDPWLSPLATRADVVLPVRVEGPSPFDSIVPATALVETLVAGVLARLGDAAQERIRRAETLTSPDVLETNLSALGS